MEKLLTKLLCAFIPVKRWRTALKSTLLTHKWPITDEAISNEMKFNVVPNRFWGHFNSGHWEPETINFYKKHVSPLKEVIDFGGWIGSTTLIAYSFNAKKISVVEADPANYQILKTNCIKNHLNDKVEHHCCCIYDKSDEILTFGYTDKSNEDSSTQSIGGERVKVRTVSLIDFLTTKDLNDTSIIKIDIEGGEQFIAKGLDYISQFPNINVLFSLHPPFWADKQKTTDILLKELNKFEIYTEKEEVIPLEKVKEMMLSEKSCGWDGKSGIFFTLILKTKNAN